MWWWIILGLGILFVLWFFKRIKKTDDLDSQISGVRSRWDDVCAKIKKMVGC